MESKRALKVPKAPPSIQTSIASTRSRQDLMESVRTRYLKKFGRDASPQIDSAVSKLMGKTKVGYQVSSFLFYLFFHNMTSKIIL